ncbi:MAG: DUF1841 family protein [Burkholderiales bacterium]|nr:DUF1841 family protein [Burkholderiales bacterium]
MFAPTRDEARQFFFDTWHKYRAGEALAGLETVALQVLLSHPEYRAILDAPREYGDRDYTPEAGETNPFLHLSLHLAIEEQLSIDQPPGIRAQFKRLCALKGEHDAKHDVLECLGEIIWQAQRNMAAPDPEMYLECLRRRS